MSRLLSAALYSPAAPLLATPRNRRPLAGFPGVPPPRKPSTWHVYIEVQTYSHITHNIQTHERTRKHLHIQRHLPLQAKVLFTVEFSAFTPFPPGPCARRAGRQTSIKRRDTSGGSNLKCECLLAADTQRGAGLDSRDCHCTSSLYLPLLFI